MNWDPAFKSEATKHKVFISYYHSTLPKDSTIPYIKTPATKIPTAQEI